MVWQPQSEQRRHKNELTQGLFIVVLRCMQMQRHTALARRIQSATRERANNCARKWAIERDEWKK